MLVLDHQFLVLHTSDDLDQRLQCHNLKHYGQSFIQGIVGNNVTDHPALYDD